MILLIIAAAVFSADSYKHNNSITIGSSSSITIERADGTVNSYSGSKFPQAEKNDRLTFRVDLPERPDSRNYSLFSGTYNQIVTVRFEDEILFTYGTEQYETGQQIGNILITADIPDRAWGKSLDVELFIADYSYLSVLPDVEIRKSTERADYLLKGNPFSYILSAAFLVMCLIGIIPCILWKSGGRIRKEGIKLLFLCVSVMVWSIGFQQMQFVVFDNTPLICNSEYIGIFCLPFSYIMFLCQIQKKGKFKKALHLTEIIFGILLAVFFVLNYFCPEMHFCRTLPVIHAELISLFIFTGFYCFINRNSKQLQIISMRNASVILAVTAALDALTFFLKNRGTGYTNIMFTPFGIFSFILIMMLSYLSYLLEFIITARESKRLKKLAYTDGMTGVSNRRSCLDYIAEMNSCSSPYGIVFVDVNNLKLANDKYSHDTGDRLICTVAEILKEAFDGCFCGRYGGDEFIAGVQAGKNISDDIEKRLKLAAQKIDEVNSQNLFPFKVSIACGYADTENYPGKNADELLCAADQNMYENKKAMKAAEKAASAKS